MIYLKYFVQTLIFVITTANYAFATPMVQLLCERNRTETNWIDYRITLKNTSPQPIHNPKIHYYAANTDIVIDIDHITNSYFTTPIVTKAREIADIELNIRGTLAPQKHINIKIGLP